MNFNLKDTAKEKLILVAHRGVWGGNIPCNTIPAYNIALKQGADMIEVDIEMSADGKLYIFHPGMEKALLYSAARIKNIDSDYIKHLRYVNIDTVPTQFPVYTLDDVLEEFKDRCYINADKFWFYPKEISEAIRKHNMMDQILVKTDYKKEYLDIIEEYCPDVQYMAIVRDPLQIEEVKKRKINYVGNEVLFSSEDSLFASPEFIEKQHKDGLLVWCNSIVYNYKTVLAAGHNDDNSLIIDPAYGWGWIADRGFDFMQTDWVMMAAEYLKSAGKLYRK